MSGNNFFADFNEDSGFDDSLLQTGKSKTENGYLQNEAALEFFKKKQADWNNILMVNAAVSSLGLMGVPLLGIFGCFGTLASIELSLPIDRTVSVMKMLLEEFKEEGITITPHVKIDNGIVDLLVKTSDRRCFAILLRSNGESRVRWREDKQLFYAVRKGHKSKWSGLELLGEKLNRAMLLLKEKESPLLGASKNERGKGFTKVIVLTSKTRLDPNNAPELFVTFGRTRALRMVKKSTYYLVDRANLADFLRKPVEK